jgi:hypothetical protein
MQSVTDADLRRAGSLPAHSMGRQPVALGSGFVHLPERGRFQHRCVDRNFLDCRQSSLFRGERTIVIGSFGPPVGFVSYFPIGFGGFAPSYVRPNRGSYGFEPATVFDPRGQPVPLGSPWPRGAATDVPERVVEQLAAPRRPTLADRAEAARLEGAADRNFRAGQFGRAVERYQQALERAPDNDDAQFKLGAALMAAGQYDAAGQTLRDALHRRPDWPHVAHDLRSLFSDDAAVRRVLAALERESRRLAADPDVPFLRGYLLYFTGERAAAAAIFRNPPRGAPAEHFTIFAEAIERQR